MACDPVCEALRVGLGVSEGVAVEDGDILGDIDSEGDMDDDGVPDILEDCDMLSVMD